MRLRLLRTGFAFRRRRCGLLRRPARADPEPSVVIEQRARRVGKNLEAFAHGFLGVILALIKLAAALVAYARLASAARMRRDTSRCISRRCGVLKFASRSLRRARSPRQLCRASAPHASSPLASASACITLRGKPSRMNPLRASFFQAAHRST